MNSRSALAVVLLFLFSVACQRAAPTQPTASPVVPASSQLGASQTLELGETASITLDATVYNGGSYCEVGGDPAPCRRFVVDVPRAGTLIVRMEFETARPMFISLFGVNQGVTKPVVDECENVDGDQSPLEVREAVTPGQVRFDAGLNVGWGIKGAEVRFRLIPTLE